MTQSLPEWLTTWQKTLLNNMVVYTTMVLMIVAALA